MTQYMQSDTEAAVRHLEDRLDVLVERSAREDEAAAGMATLINAITDSINILDDRSVKHGRKLDEIEGRVNQLLIGLATRGIA